jgi:hypothetical protein
VSLVGSYGQWLSGDAVSLVTARLGILNPNNQALSGWIFRNVPDPSAATTVWLLLVAAVVVTTAAVCARDANSSRRWRLEFALVTSAITMIMPFTWVHQFVVLLIPLFVLLEWSLSEPSGHWMLAPLIAVGAICSASNVRAFDLEYLVDAHLALCLLTWGLSVHLLRSAPADFEADRDIPVSAAG